MSKSIGIFQGRPFGVGGIERWVRTLLEMYGKNYNITLYYDRSGLDPDFYIDGTIEYLSQFANIVEYTGQDIELDIGVWCWDEFARDQVEAETAYLFVHSGDGWAGHDNFKNYEGRYDKILAVSHWAGRVFSDKSSLPTGVFYNPVHPSPLRLITVSRPEKNKGYDRMVKLAEALKRSGVDYTWDFYTRVDAEPIDGINLKAPKNNVEEEIRASDYLIQLPDFESFGYSLVEGMRWSNLVTTDIEILPEMGINRDNAIILPLEPTDDQYDAAVELMVAKIYKPPQSDITELFGEPTEQGNKIVVKNTSEPDVLVNGYWLEGEQEMSVSDTPQVRDLIEKGILKEL